MKQLPKIKRYRRGRIKIHEARLLFGQLAFGRPMKISDHDGTFALNDAWNWFRVGIEVAQNGKVKNVSAMRERFERETKDSQNERS